MIAYRLTRSKYAHDLARTGGYYAAGRCNHKGTAVIYAAQHVSLALIEILVHLELSEIPLDYTLVTVEIPDSVALRQATPEEALAASTNPDVPVFLVPSVVVPQELNVVIYPQAFGFEATVKKVEPFRIDERLLARGWQSKSVEAQIWEFNSQPPIGETRTSSAEEMQLQMKKADLELSRKLVLQQLERSDSERYSELLRRTLAGLEAQIADLD